jgi:hypothetical protein
MKNYTVTHIPKKEAIPWVCRMHYAKRKPSITNSFGLFSGLELVGVCLYGMPPAQMDINGEPLRELCRLVLAEHMSKKNILSWFVSQTFKLMPKPLLLVSFADPNYGHFGYIYQATNWIYTGLSQKGGKDGVWHMNGRGYHSRTVTEVFIRKLYQAYDSTKGMRENWYAAGGTISEPLRKHRYFMPLGNKAYKRRIVSILHKIYGELPYPKGNSSRYDTGGNVETQGRFFI